MNHHRPETNRYLAEMRLIYCDHTHADAIGEIFNEAIVNSTALYDYEPRSPEVIDKWISDKIAAGFPILGVTTDSDELAGFASFGRFRPWDGYRYSIEHSLYVHKDYRGQGVGRRLLENLLVEAQQRQFHTIIGVLDGQNVASARLHLSLGFEKCGEIREAGFKFGSWLDVHFYQKILTVEVSE